MKSNITFRQAKRNCKCNCCGKEVKADAEYLAWFVSQAGRGWLEIKICQHCIRELYHTLTEHQIQAISNTTAQYKLDV